MNGIPDFAKAPLFRAYADNLFTLKPESSVETSGFSFDMEASSGAHLDAQSLEYLRSICDLKTGPGSSAYLFKSDQKVKIDSAKPSAKYLSLHAGKASNMWAGYSYNTSILLKAGDFCKHVALDAEGDNTIYTNTGDCCVCIIRTDYTVGSIRFESKDSCEFHIGFCTHKGYNGYDSYSLNLSFIIGNTPAAFYVNDKEYRLWPNSRDFKTCLGGRHYGDKTNLVDIMCNHLDTWYRQYTDDSVKKAKADARGKFTEPKREIA